MNIHLLKIIIYNIYNKKLVLNILLYYKFVKNLKLWVFLLQKFFFQKNKCYLTIEMDLLKLFY